MAIKYKVAKVKLNYLEEKPEVYKIQQLTYPVITESALIEYISRSTSLPKSTVQSCVTAIGEAISFFVINGHRVSFTSFGSFFLKVSTKVAQTLEECNASTVKKTGIGSGSPVRCRQLFLSERTFRAGGRTRFVRHLDEQQGGGNGGRSQR